MDWIIGIVLVIVALGWVLAVYQKAVLKGKARRKAAGE